MGFKSFSTVLLKARFIKLLSKTRSKTAKAGNFPFQKGILKDYQKSVRSVMQWGLNNSQDSIGAYTGINRIRENQMAKNMEHSMSAGFMYGFIGIVQQCMQTTASMVGSPMRRTS